jgi:hypothetical protein
LRRSQIGNERSIAMFAFKLNQLFLSSSIQDSTIAYSAHPSVLAEPLAESKSPQPRASHA